MSNYFIVYNDSTNLDVNLLVINRPSKPAPVMEYEEVKVPGGKTLYREKGYGDIEITVSFNFMSKYSWDKDFRKIKQWLLSKVNNKLKFSDDLEVFYRVNKVTIETPERVMKKVGRFNVTFICNHLTYIEENERELPQALYNDYLVAKPIYRIVGEGYLTMNINNKTIKANVGQELIIDTDKGLCYRKGIINNVALEGKYADMYLQEGNNTFSWTNGFKIYILPNWGCL
ncbi:phage tail family protein [Clostridium tertium]|uniref:distal tail protein Dit n=1 Tax=Clostridium tertium TaxID=1559 RepID=UPI00232FE16B|nr:distal tail protein Dit [Clostridium tertium]MDB1956019.1 phage tail family protein [Clostridium tertium]MDB1959014.1 phage tail family protein [Clostridium tertium]MDB1962091.1 phage tail family protein [Clostridium tertium]MDB1967164.1 phage tail family protein [Clostridium tertium]